MVVRVKKTNKFEARIIRNKYIAAFVLVSMLNQILLPGLTMALTNGPVQPTAMSFEPVTTNQMVDLASGDFTYNIPLFELPGPNGSYPFNLFYNSGVTMDQEASMYGLGWNLNPGMINKNTRGIDDQSNGDEIMITEDMKQNITFGGSFNFRPEVFGFDPSKGFSLGLGIKIYYNNYKGVGAGISAPMSYGIDVNLGIDSQEGGTISLSHNHSRTFERINQKYTYGLGLSSKRGLSFSTSLRENKLKRYKGPKITGSGGTSFSFAETSFSPILSNEMRSINASFSIGGGPETSGFYGEFGFGVFYNQEWQANSNDSVAHKSYGYNYLHNADTGSITDFNREKDEALHKWSKNIGVSNYTYDTYVVKGQGIGSSFRPFRTKFGSVSDPRKVSYGGGAHLNIEVGVGLLAKVGGGGGINFNSSIVETWNDNENEIYNELNFKEPLFPTNRNILDEKTYYKSHGEMTTINKSELAHIGGEQPIAAKFHDKYRLVDKIYELKNKFISKSGVELPAQGNRAELRGEKREKRNTSILEIKNSELTGLANEGVFNFSYYEIQSLNNYVESNLVKGNRTDRASNVVPNKVHNITNHTGAFSVLNNSGLRYNYGIPVYNNGKIEEIVSVEGRDNCTYKIAATKALFTKTEREKIDFSDEYYKKSVYPSSVQNYLLTNILGTDYVDIDAIPGPSDGDKGYWVKFNYLKDEDYKWRAPYTGAIYMPGSELTGSDDKASYTYGSRENYYLATAETETHIAKFTMSERDDALAAKGQYDDKGASLKKVKKSYKVDKIELFVKAEYLKKIATGKTPIALQTTHFEYTTTLCPGILNSSSGGGKLTLSKVWTTYQNNTRGSLSPYVFNYGSNKTYHENFYNRWGGYKEYGSDSCRNLQNPYVEQFRNNHLDNNGVFNPETAAKDHKDDTDEYAGAWSMNKITLPSGAEIHIEYEADDYGYVQHKQAAQMFQVVSTNNTKGNNVLYDKDDWDENEENANDNQLRLYFNLEKPIKETEYIANKTKAKKTLFDNYIKPTKTPEDDYQLYFKTKVQFRDNFNDYVSGFVKLNTSANKYGFDENPNTFQNINNEQYITRGYVTMKPIASNFWMQREPKYFHPISFHAWQYMQKVKPDLITAISTTNKYSDNITKKSGKDRALAIKSFLGAFVQAGQMFKTYTKQCFNRDFSDKIDLSSSWIRLGSPDKTKFGGGSRVAKVYMKDNWGETDPLHGGAPIVYGQEYDYSIKEGGETISSGVASFEPMIGGNENILRYARINNRKIALKASEVSSFKYPVNESLFPGARVVYRKVTTRSIGTKQVMDNKSNGVNDQRIANRAKSGVKVNTFATCKKYPTIVEETKIQKDNYKLWIPIPFIGLIQNSQMGASQGYSIISNDMAGKPLSEETYKVNEDGSLGSLVSSVNYEYQATPDVYQNEKILRLNNEVEVIKDQLILDGKGKQTEEYVKEKKYMGVEYDLHSDFRHSQSVSGSIGVNVNIDLILLVIIPIPVPTVLPEFSLSTADMKTGVINKIIHKTAILKSVTATDGQSTVKTENLLYDDLTGTVVLTKVNNNYDAPVYSMNIPAHWKYERMQAASENSGIEFPFTFDVHTNNLNIVSHDFVTDIDANSITSATQYITGADFNKNVSEGDELLIQWKKPFNWGKVSFFGVMMPNNVIHIPNLPVSLNNQTNLKGTAKVIRSKNRNLLSAVAGNIVALNDPTEDIGTSTQFKTNALASELESFLNAALVDKSIPYSTFWAQKKWMTNEIKNAGYPLLASKIYFIIDKSSQNLELEILFKDDTICTLKLINRLGKTANIKISVDGDLGLIVENFTNQNSKIDSQKLSCFNPYLDQHKHVSEVLQASAVEFKDEWSYKNDLKANKYLTGEKGIWRVSKNHYYKDERYSTDEKSQYKSGEQKLSKDGVFRGAGGESDNTKWDKNFFFFNWEDYTQHKKWIPNETITKYNRDGFAIESKDILGNFSFAKYGYGGNLVTVVGANSKEQEVYFEDFEYQNSLYNTANPTMRHNKINGPVHSGSHALSVSKTLTATLPELRLNKTKQYSFSAWIKMPSNINVPLASYSFSGIKFSDAKTTGFWQDGKGDIVALPVGEIIEGWQKVEATITVPANVADNEQLQITILNPAPAVRIDDIRVCPLKSAVKTYVYNPDNFRLVAELDNNNFATFYYYDSQGSLHLTKVETSEGVMTVSESRGHIKN